MLDKQAESKRVKVEQREDALKIEGSERKKDVFSIFLSFSVVLIDFDIK